jgi:chemotaxis signal transduction protein
METITPDQYCVFHLDDEWFAVLATSIREIDSKPDITSIPKSSKHLLGLCHVRNEFIPVAELMPGSAPENRKQMAVITSPGGTWAILVDEVVTLTSLDFSMSSSGDNNPLISAAVMGTATYDGRIVRVFDVNAVYRQLEKTLSNFWAKNTVEHQEPIS